MTERLYYHDAALLTFDAVVIGHHGGDDRQLILDRSAFYPTSGGQPHDTGSISGVTVVDVTDEDGVVVHHMAAPVPSGPVRGTIDAARRHDHMQQHSAQHLLSALAADRLKWPTTSVHFGADTSAIEVSAAAVPPAQLQQLEDWANALVAEARPVTVTFEEADEANARGLRTRSSRTGSLRIVTIADIDRSACGGTHVLHTSEIGAIRLTGVEKVRGQSRISFVAGDRTLERLRSLEQQTARAAEQLGCAPAEVADLLPRRLEELRSARERLGRLEVEQAKQWLAALAVATARSDDGVLRMCFEGDATFDQLRGMAQQVGTLERAALAGTMADGATVKVVVGSSADSGIDAGAVVRALMAQRGGKGGGSPRLGQGALAGMAPSAGELIAMLRAAD